VTDAPVEPVLYGDGRHFDAEHPLARALQAACDLQNAVDEAEFDAARWQDFAEAAWDDLEFLRENLRREHKTVGDRDIWIQRLQSGIRNDLLPYLRRMKQAFEAIGYPASLERVEPEIALCEKLLEDNAGVGALNDLERAQRDASRWYEQAVDNGTRADKAETAIRRIHVIAHARRDLPVWQSVLDEIRRSGVDLDPKRPGGVRRLEGP
jgi:hypothetical protein